MIGGEVDLLKLFWIGATIAYHCIVIRLGHPDQLAMGEVVRRFG